MKTVLGIGKKISEETWKSIIAEVDKNGDNQISYEEFEQMMNKFLS